VADAQAATPLRPSIVNGQIAAALRGAFGDVQTTRRTSGSELFVNPLMAVYFTVDLDGPADATSTSTGSSIEAFRETVVTRVPEAFPH
jgi:hypothetical protein